MKKKPGELIFTSTRLRQPPMAEFLLLQKQATSTVPMTAAASWLSLPSPYEGSFYGTLPLTNTRVSGFRSARQPVLLGGRRQLLAGIRSRAPRPRSTMAFVCTMAGSSWSASPGPFWSAAMTAKASACTPRQTGPASKKSCRPTTTCLILIGEQGVRRLAPARTSTGRQDNDCQTP